MARKDGGLQEMDEACELLKGVLVRNVKTDEGALRVGFEGRHHLWVRGAWRVEAVATAAPEPMGALIGQSLGAMTAGPGGLAFTFSRHRIVAVPSHGQGEDAAEPLAILYEADYPAIVW